VSTRFRLEDLPPAMRDQARQKLGQVPRGTPTPKPKYGNQVVEVDGDVFGSKWELKRYRELQEQLRAGLIKDLRHHVSFPLHVLTPTGDRVRIGAYEADMVYRRGEELVIEDTKSEATRTKDLYRWKAAHFEAEYGLKLLDVVRVRRKRADREVRCG
jgi:hypothetical protein